MTSARHKYEAIVGALRVKHAQSTTLPNEAVIDIHPGNEVLVDRKKKAGTEHTSTCTGTENSPLYLTQKA